MIRPGIRRVFRLPIWRRDLAEQELDEEVRLHLELRAEQLEREGLSPEAAWAEARRRFDAGNGDHANLRRAARRRDKRLRFREWLSGLLRDARYTGRSFRRQPFFAIGVVGTLGLGLATATLVFVVAWRVWFAPMPYPDPEGVVRMYEIEPTETPAGVAGEIDTARRHRFSPSLLADFRSHTWRTIEAVSEVWRGGQARWARDGQTQTIATAMLSPEGFGILGIVPTLGRLPSKTEMEVLLSERFWRTYFGADPAVIGSTMNLGSRPSPRIVGVGRVPGGYLDDPHIVGVIDREDEGRAIRFIETIARVRPGFSVAEAQAEIDAFMTAVGGTYPAHRGWSVEAVVLAEDLVRPFRDVLVLLLAAGATFLLLATVNVLGLVAARRVESRHDRAIRLALGASEGRLLRSALIESLVLAAVGSTIGILSAYWLIDPMRAMVPQDVPRLGDVAVTPAFVLGVLAVGGVLGAIIGSIGYLISRSVPPAIGRAPTSRGIGVRGRRALVVGQVALTTLFTAAGVAILHRVSTLNAIDLGFEPEGLWSTVITGAREPTSNEEAAAQWAGTWRQVLERLEARGVPATLAFNPPMSGEDESMGGGTLGIRPDAASEEIFYRAHVVSPGYFATMGIQLLAGRAFAHTDDASAEKVVIVSEEFAEAYLPPGTPMEGIIGRVLEPAFTVRGPATVVGVVESTRHLGPDAPVEPDLYVLYAQQPTVPVRTLIVRGDPDRVAEAVSTVLAGVDGNLRQTPLIPYATHLSNWFAPLRLQLVMIWALGVIGLVLASLGVYSLMAYQVAARRKELGIRKAVGAPDDRLMWGVLASSTAMTMVGAVIGLGAWYWLLPWTRNLVEGIDAAGPVVPLAVVLVMGGACVLATLGPAVRAARVDPAATLRVD